MGVIFCAADDVADLLIPFIAESGGETNAQAIQAAYLDASLGNISADDFWFRVRVSPELEDTYLSRHLLTPGVKEFFCAADEKRIPVWCLSNDVGRWSNKLRKNLEIEQSLAGSVISGDIGVRKPDSGIYEKLLELSGYSVEDILFVDDRKTNVNAARRFGIESIVFRPEAGFPSITERVLNGAL